MAGPKGDLGPTGARGPTGIVDCWASYREFWFDASSSTLSEEQTADLKEMAAYVKNNPSLTVGIDGRLDPMHKDLSHSRVNAVRDALIDNGVPAERIKLGAFGDPKLRQNGRVEVLIMTTDSAR